MINNNYYYIDGIVRNMRSSLGVTPPSQPVATSNPLVSIHMQSNRPQLFRRFLDNLEASLDMPERVEVIVKIDDTDMAMNTLLPQEVIRRPFTLKYISTPLPGGFFDLWHSMNDMLEVCHSQTYFVWNLNDEVSILSKGWDTAISKYVGLFPDHIFRLRTSMFRIRNYYDFWECGFAPDSSALHTKRWLDICGNWNPCFGPDSFNQCVAFYMGYHERFYQYRPVRDIPIYDILLSGEGCNVGLEGEKLRKRARGAYRAWRHLMSHTMQTEASRRAQKLMAHIEAHTQGLDRFTVTDNSKSQHIFLTDPKGETVGQFPYRLSFLRIALTNLWRTTCYYYYNGGGLFLRRRRLLQICGYLALRFDAVERIYQLWKQLRPQPNTGKPHWTHRPCKKH